MKSVNIIIIISILLIIGFTIFIILYNKNNISSLSGITIKFTNTLSFSIRAIFIQDSNMNTYPMTLSSPIAQNQLVTIPIPKSYLNSDITSLVIVCTESNDINDRNGFGFSLISDNNNIIYYPIGRGGDITPTFTSGNTLGTLIPPTTNNTTCVGVCTNSLFPTTGAITVTNNHTSDISILVNSQRVKLEQGTELFRNGPISPGSTITTAVLDNLSKAITIVSVDGNENAIEIILLYKLSNGKISRVVFGPNILTIGLSITPGNLSSNQSISFIRF